MNMSESMEPELGVDSETSQTSDSPKKGPTISTSTGSFEVLDQHDPNISRLATKLFEKTSDYLLAELSSTQDDYKLLEKMNNLTAAKYVDMHQITRNIDHHMKDLNDQYKQIQPLLNAIKNLHDDVSKLENAAYKLDVYTNRLEEKYKTLQKRYTASQPL